MTLIVNTAWLGSLRPTTCEWGRVRNQIEQRSPRSRVSTIIAQMRPLWFCKLTWRMPGDFGNDLRWHLENLEGQRGSVLLWDFGATPRNDLLTNTLTVRVAALVNATSVQIQGAPVSVAALFARGELIQIARRLYMISATVASDASGFATLTLTTPLLAAASVGAAVTAVNPRVEMRMVEASWSNARRAEDGVFTARAEFIETVSDYTAVGPSMEQEA